MSKRPRGTGSIRSRNGWYEIKYYVDGVPRREAAHTKDRAVAQGLLNKRLGKIASGGSPIPRRERVRVGELLDAYLQDIKLRNRKDQKHAVIAVRRLRSALGYRRASAIRADDIRKYVIDRRATGIGNGSINRELAILRRSFNLAVEGDVIDRAPRFRLLPEAAPRSGFFEREKFEAVLKHMRFEIVKDIAIVGYWLGWRISEIVTLEHRQIDVARKCIVLEPGKTKGGEGRVVYPPPPAWAVIEKWHGKRVVADRIVARVFHRAGRPVQQVRRHWNTACRLAGYPGMRFHDLRRTAVRNMVRSGIPESVAMRVTGHRTRTVFERYNITSEDDMKTVATKMTNGHVSPESSEIGRTGGRTEAEGQKK